MMGFLTAESLVEKTDDMTVMMMAEMKAASLA